MQTALPNVQIAFYQALTAHTPLMNKITGVLDDVKADQPFPYVTLGEPVSTPWDSKTSVGENITWVLHCWSQYEGKREAYEILNLMHEAFTTQSLSVSGFSVSDFRREQQQVITDIDGLTRHGILNVRLWLT